MEENIFLMGVGRSVASGISSQRYQPGAQLEHLPLAFITTFANHELCKMGGASEAANLPT